MNTGKKYQILCSDATSPSFNLACEEYLLSGKNESFLLLWRNSPSVIIGRNQNAHAEINTDYLKKHNICVIRRLTGGGAVYHDLGNINFSYIFNSDSLIDLKAQFCNIIEFLKSLGIDAEFSGRNDITVNGHKISGTAQVSKKGRSIVHGTLLYSADLTVLSKVLLPNPLKLESKGISSVKSRVTNIADLLKKKMSVEEFFKSLYSFLLKKENCTEYQLSKEDISQIEKLQTEKYNTWNWNFGNAPQFSTEKSVLAKCGLLTANYTVKNGVIEAIKFYGDFNAVGNIEELERMFLSLSVNPQVLKSQLKNINFENFIQNSSYEDFLKLFE